MVHIYSSHAREVETGGSLAFTRCFMGGSTKARCGWERQFSDRIPTEEERNSSALSTRPSWEVSTANLGKFVPQPRGRRAVSSAVCAPVPSGSGQLLLCLSSERKLPVTPGSYLFSLTGPGRMWLSATQELRADYWCLMGRGLSWAAPCEPIRDWRYQLQTPAQRYTWEGWLLAQQEAREAIFTDRKEGSIHTFLPQSTHESIWLFHLHVSSYKKYCPIFR